MKQSKAKTSEGNRRKILKAGQRLILAQGIEALSVRKLAAESNLALRSIYNLFGNKENILVALFEFGTRPMDDAMELLETAMTRESWKTDFYLKWLERVEPMFFKNAAVIKPGVIAGFSPVSPTSEQTSRLHNQRIQRIKDALTLAAEKDLIWKDLDLDVCARLLYGNYFNVVMQWAKGELDDRELIVYSRYTILTILHTLINEPDRRENTLNLLKELKEEK